jgi:hypothetical protein
LLALWSWAASAQQPVVPDFNPKLARTFAALAQATYCDTDHDAIRNWTCGPCRHSGLDVIPGSVRFVKHREVWQANSTFIIVARVAQRAKDDEALGCIAAFRGSDALSNWIKDFEVWTDQVPFPWCDCCRVEAGFWTVWAAVEKDLIAALGELGCRPRGEKPLAPNETDLVAFTGHSLGAAVASVATILLAQMGFKVGMSYNFESPRFGNDIFAKTYDDVFTHQFPTYRVTYAMDPVPHLPPRIPILFSRSYTHAGFEAYYPGNGTDVVVCKRNESPNCSQRYSLARTLPHVFDHCVSPLAFGGDICECPAAAPQTVLV